jgi:hypothetical protein
MCPKTFNSLCYSWRSSFIKCPPWDPMHASTRLIMDRRIRAKMLGQLRIVWQASTMRCQQELHTQGCLGVPTGKNPEDSNPAGAEALSIGHERCHWYLAQHGAPSCILSAITCKLNVSGHMLMWMFFWYVELVPKACPHPVYVFSTHCVFILRVSPKQHCSIYVYNGNGIRFLWGTNWKFMTSAFKPVFREATKREVSNLRQ